MWVSSSVNWRRLGYHYVLVLSPVMKGNSSYLIPDDIINRLRTVIFQIQPDHFAMLKIDTGIGDLNDQRTAGDSTKEANS